jgi:hypothetical protein
MFVPSSHLSEESARVEKLIKRRIVDGEVEFLGDIWNDMMNAKVLVSSLLTRDKTQRATVYSALSSTWIRCDVEDLDYAYQHRVVATKAR